MSAGLQDQGVRWLMQAVAAAGVDQLLVCPGSRSTPLVQAALALERLGAWTVHVVLDERQAGFAALGMARAQARPAVITTSGSAVAHLLPACVEAGETGVGLLLLTADRPPRLRGCGAPQTVRQTALLTAYAHCLDLDLSQGGSDADRRAALAALERWRGGEILQLNACLDLPLAMAPWQPVALEPPPSVERIAPRSAAGLGLRPPQMGERVVIVAGPLAADAELAALIGPLSQQALVLAEATSGLASHARRAGAPLQWDALLRDPQLLQRLKPDRIVRLGEWPASKGLQLLLETSGAVVDAVAGPRPSDPPRQLREVSPLPPAQALRDWLEAPAQADEVRQWRAAWRTADDAAVAAVRALPGDGWERGALAALQAELSGQHWLVVGNSMPVRDLDALQVTALPACRVVCSRGANGIDGTLAMAWGVAKASRQPVRVYLGDSALLHDVGALQLLCGDRAELDLKVLVVDNDGGAIFDYLPARAQMDAGDHLRCFTAPHGRDLAAVAAAFGVTARATRDADELASVWQGLATGTAVVVFQVDRGHSIACHRRWQGEAVRASRRALGLDAAP